MKNKTLLLSGLSLLFAVLMSVPFLVPHCGFFALFGFVPLLCMDRVATLTGTRRVWIYHYSAFLLWNAFTTFWVCNATLGGGIFASLANSFQMSLVFGLFRFSKKRFSGTIPYLFLAVAWIAWERAYFDADISWPWLVLGNAFARSVASVQWYEYTGTLGGSLWIWICNLSIFGLMTVLSDGKWSGFNVKARIAAVTGLLTVLIAPFIVSRVIYETFQEKEDPMEVIIFQPNIDPYNKFRAKSQEQQNAILLGQMAEVMKNRSAEGTSSDSQVLLLAPETFTGDVIVGDWNSSLTWRRLTSFLKNWPGANMIFGASSYSFSDAAERPSHTARRLRDGRWMESHNSALMIDGTGRTEIFHKSKLVVAVEKTPYPAVFCKIDDLLGGVMGRCVGQDSVSVLHCVAPDVILSEAKDLPCDNTVAVGCAVCYESVYGEYFTDYVKAGAEVMTVITNDSWWGNTPGYRQHLSYSSLRAIETRRSIARCANTGISALIDQRGIIHDPTPWWQPAVLQGSINKNDKITFFVSHGDIAGRVCTFVFLLLCAALLVAFLKDGNYLKRIS